VLCPGFIDLHSHLDFTLSNNRRCTNLVAQGITMAIGGNCGFSAAPTGPRMAKHQEDRGREAHRGRLSGWFEKIEALGLGLHVGTYVGQGNLRADAMGTDATQPPTRDQMREMKRTLRTALDDGAFGLSTGRDYVPGCYSTEEEIRDLASALSGHTGAFYISHLLDESAGLVAATREALSIGRSAGVPTLLSHHKAVVPTNRGLTRQSLALVDEALDEGYDARLDVYPYDFSATIHLFDMLPDRITARGRDAALATLRDDEAFSRVANELHSGYPGWTSALADFDFGYTVLVSPGHPGVNGMTIADIARDWGLDPAETVRRLVLADSGQAICSLTMDEDDVSRVIAHPRAAICTDSPALDSPEGNFRTSIHPRSYGTYPRLFARYVREKGVLSIEEAVYRCTGLPASWLGLSNRGIIAPGAHADLVLFDPEAITDHATLENPTEGPEGVNRVMVNGIWAVEDGTPTGSLSGQVIRRDR